MAAFFAQDKILVGQRSVCGFVPFDEQAIVQKLVSASFIPDVFKSSKHFKLLQALANRLESEPLTVDPEKRIVYHGAPIGVVPSIIKYGYFGDIKWPTVARDPISTYGYHWEGYVVFVFKALLQIFHGHSLDGQLFSEEGLSTEYRVSKLPDDLRTYLKSLQSDPTGTIKNLLNAERAHQLVHLEPNSLNLKATLLLNKTRMINGLLSETDFQFLKDHLEIAMSSPTEARFIIAQQRKFRRQTALSDAA